MRETGQVSTASEASLPPWVAGVEDRLHELDPELSDAQIDVVRGYGKERSYGDGEWLWKSGDRDAGFFLVLDGALEIVSGTGNEEAVIITHHRGHYGGEIVTMAGRSALVSGRARGETRVIRLTTEQLKQLLALESELGEILLVSFIVRRMRMIAENQGEVTLLGDPEEAETAKVRTFLSRQGVPHRLIAPGDQRGTSYGPGDWPVLVVGEQTLRKPSIRAVAEAIGVAAEIESGSRFDLAVIGGGPAGLAAAVYGASEGLSVIVLESMVPGGQAGTSSRIENYLGFPTGISGQGLAGRAFLQATKFGTEVAVARKVEQLECADTKRIHLDGGDVVEAGAVVLSTGAVYREPPIKNLEKFTGGGVHYGASFLEGQLCRDKDIAVVGGGNSAGQAAIYLAGFARKVLILIRREGLESTMSSYLIDRINKLENVEVLGNTEVQCANGDTKLRSLTLTDGGELNVAHLFVFIGAVPATDFVPADIRLDDRGFVVTGDRLDQPDLEEAGWPLERHPYYLETSYPGIFAVGDVRSGSVKRVASAVGEGSVCVQFVHQVLDQITP